MSMNKSELTAVVELIGICREYADDETLEDICADMYGIIEDGEYDELYEEDDLNALCTLVQDISAVLDGDDR